MLRRAYNWLLLVLPAGWAVGLAFGVWLFFEGLVAFFDWQFGAPGVRERFLRARDLFAIGASACWGLFRVAGLHPLFDETYRGWLSLTPWRRGLPLPVGPVHLAPQDGVIMAAMLLALHDAQLPRLALPAAFLFSYLAVLLLTFASAGFWRACYTLAFALGAAVWLRLESPEGLGLLAMLVVAAQFVLSRTLDEFPWTGVESLHAKRDPHQQARVQLLEAGWPFAQLQPDEPILGIRYRDGVLLSLLIGWWALAICSTVRDPQGREVLETMIRVFSPAAIVISRLATYLPRYRSPIGPLGRLLTLRWIIPGYDRVFAAPLLILLIQFFAPGAIGELSAWLGVRLPAVQIVLTLSLLAALNLGPTLRDWRLASRCRIVPGMLNPREFVEL